MPWLRFIVRNRILDDPTERLLNLYNRTIGFIGIFSAVLLMSFGNEICLIEEAGNPSFMSVTGLMPYWKLKKSGRL